MDWGTHLWDQFDHMEKHTQWGMDFLEKYAKFVKERVEIEQSYAKQLRNLVKKFSNRMAKEEESRYTSCMSFHVILSEVDDYACQREVVARDLEELVYGKLVKRAQEIKGERKKHLQEGKKAQQHLDQCFKQMESSKKKFEREWKEVEKLQLCCDRLEKESNTSADIEKARLQMNTRSRVAEESKNEYATQLQNFNVEQRKHYSTCLPQIYNSLQDMDERRCRTLGDMYRFMAEVEQRVIPIVSKGLVEMIQAGRSVDPQKDCGIVVELYKSGLEPPGDVPFEDFSQNQSQLRRSSDSSNVTSSPVIPDARHSLNKAKKKLWNFAKRPKSYTFSQESQEMPLDGFSQLPPDQRRKKLKETLDHLRKDLHKEMDTKGGLLKMKDVYERNPKMGHAEILQSKISETVTNIEQLRSEIYLHEGFLAQLERNQSALETKEMQSQVNQSSYEDWDSLYEDICLDRDMDSQNNEDDLYSDVDNIPQQATADDCIAVYSFDGKDNDSLVMRAGETLHILQPDKGDGWTRVCNGKGQAGYVPTSYLGSL